MLGNDPSPQSDRRDSIPLTAATAPAVPDLAISNRRAVEAELQSPISQISTPISYSRGIRMLSWAIEKFPTITILVAQHFMNERKFVALAEACRPAAGWEVLEHAVIHDRESRLHLMRKLLPAVLISAPERIRNADEFRAILPSLDEQLRCALAKRCFVQKPEATLTDLSLFNLNNDVHLADFLGAVIKRKPALLSPTHPLIAGLKSSVAERLVAVAAESLPILLPAILPQIADNDQRSIAVLNCAEIFKRSLTSATQLGQQLVALVESCPSLGQAERSAIAGILIRRDPKVALPAISKLGLDDQGFIAQSLMRAASSSVPSVIAQAEIVNRLPIPLRYEVLNSCLENDPAEIIENLAVFQLKDVQSSNSLARKAVELKPATTSHFIEHFGASPEVIREIGVRAITKSPFKSAPFISNFKEHAPRIAQIFWEKVCEKYPGKAVEHAAVLLHFPEAERAAAWVKLFARKPSQEVCALIPGLKLSSETCLERVRTEINSRAPELFARNLDALGLSPEIPQFKEHLKSKLERTPWVVLNTCIATGMNDQEFLRLVLDTCFSRNPRRACNAISAVISLQAPTKHQVLEDWVQANTDLFHRSRTLRKELHPQAQRLLVSAVTHSDPLSALELMRGFNLRDETLVLDIFNSPVASKRQAAALCSELSRFKTVSAATRIGMASALVTKSPDLLEDAAVALALSPEEGTQVIERSGIKSAHERAEAIRALGIYDRQLIERLVKDRTTALALLPAADQPTALRQAMAQARKAPVSTAKNIHETGLESDADRAAVAAIIAGSNFEVLSRTIHRFGLSEEQRVAILTSAAPVANGRVADHIVRFGITNGAAARPLLHSLAIRDFRSVTDRTELRGFYADEEAVWPVFHASLIAGNIKNALYTCIVQHENVSGAHATQRQTLTIFDQLLRRSIALPGLNVEQLHDLQLLERVRKFGVAPSTELLKAFEHFNNEADLFLCEVYSQAGPTGGANIVEQLTGLYRQGTEIPKPDQEVIRLFLTSGFRGFSESTFRIARESFLDSPQKARRLIDSWKNGASAILTGTSVSAEDAANPLFPEMVYAAYRPVGMSVPEIKSYLGRVKDHSDRLTQFKFPKDGYPTILAENTEVQLRAGTELLRDELKAAAKLFDTNTTFTPETETEILVKASQRGVGSLSREKVVAWMIAGNPDPRLAALRTNLKPLLADSTDPAVLRSAVVSLQEGFGVIANDAIDYALKQAIDGKRFEIRDRFTSRVLELLGKKEGEVVSPQDMRAALREELEKVFRTERQLASKELKKFSSGGARTGNLRTYVSLSSPAFFARAGAGLCTAHDTWSWDQSTYLQMITVDVEKQMIVGNTQLHLFRNRANEESVLARLNPTEKFLSTVEPRLLARAMLSCVEQFAADNNLPPYLPEQTWAHLLTNRNNFSGPLSSYYGASERTSIRVSSDLTVERVYRMRPVKRQAARQTSRSEEPKPT